MKKAFNGDKSYSQSRKLLYHPISQTRRQQSNTKEMKLSLASLTQPKDE